MTEKGSLSHYGIPGMKWGIRKALSAIRSRRSAVKARNDEKKAAKKTKDEPDETASDDHKKVSEIRKKKVSQLSNQELQAFITRTQLEKQFADLNQKKVGAGEKFVKDLLVNAGKEMATSFVKKGQASLEKQIIEGFK